MRWTNKHTAKIANTIFNGVVKANKGSAKTGVTIDQMVKWMTANMTTVEALFNAEPPQELMDEM